MSRVAWQVPARRATLVAIPRGGGLRDQDFAAPALAGRPAISLQVVGNRRKDVTRRRPDIPPSITVEVLGEFQIARGHELDLTHGAGPRASQPGHLDVAVIEDLERREQLAAEERGTPPLPGQRGERRDGRPHAAEAAEVRLDAPDRGDDRRRHAIARADLFEQRRLARECRAPARHQLRRQQPRQIFLERQDRLRLAPIALDDDRQRLFDIRQRRVDGLRSNAARERFRAHAGEEVGKRRAGVLGGGSVRCRDGDDHEQHARANAAPGQCTKN